MCLALPVPNADKMVINMVVCVMNFHIISLLTLFHLFLKLLLDCKHRNCHYLLNTKFCNTQYGTSNLINPRD